MNLQAHTRRWVAGLAASVLLLGALAPTVSRAVLPRPASLLPWDDICTTGDTSRPRASAALTPAFSILSPGAPAKPAHQAFDHCPFCLLVSERLGPTSSRYVHFFGVDTYWVRPDEQALLFVTRVLRAAQARGPPGTPDVT